MPVAPITASLFWWYVFNKNFFCKISEKEMLIRNYHATCLQIYIFCKSSPAIGRVKHTWVESLQGFTMYSNAALDKGVAVMCYSLRLFISVI